MSIEDHIFTGNGILGAESNGDAIRVFVIGSKGTTLTKLDVIAMTKHFKFNAHDVQCSEHIALQKYCQKLEDEIIAVNNTSKRLS